MHLFGYIIIRWAEKEASRKNIYKIGNIQKAMPIISAAKAGNILSIRGVGIFKVLRFSLDREYNNLGIEERSVYIVVEPVLVK